MKHLTMEDTFTKVAFVLGFHGKCSMEKGRPRATRFDDSETRRPDEAGGRWQEDLLELQVGRMTRS